MEWIKCSERMPEVGSGVIGWNGYGIRICRYVSNSYAKTAKARKPRFEIYTGIWQELLIGCLCQHHLPHDATDSRF